MSSLELKLLCQILSVVRRLTIFFLNKRFSCNDSRKAIFVSDEIFKRYLIIERYPNSPKIQPSLFILKLNCLSETSAFKRLFEIPTNLNVKS